MTEASSDEPGRREGTFDTVLGPERISTTCEVIKARDAVKTVRKLFAVGYMAIVFLFVCCALALIVLASYELWQGVNPYNNLALSRERFSALLESIGLLTVAVAAFELGQTILEEEVWREVHTSGPTRVRRFLSRFMIVIIVALAIEATISVFEFAHDDPAHLPHASLIAVAAAVLLTGWGFFIKCNTSAEMLEPEAMEDAKREDEKISSPKEMEGDHPTLDSPTGGRRA